MSIVDDKTTTIGNPLQIEAIKNPDFATVARLENYNSGRLYLTVFRDSELSHFGPICAGVKSRRVNFGKF